MIRRTILNSIYKLNNIRNIKTSTISPFTNKTLCYGLNIEKEKVFANDKNSLNISKNILKNELCSVIGYGPQGRSQALNLRDTGINVCVGVKKNGPSWFKALNDGFVENSTLFEIDHATKIGTIVLFLVSDAGLIEIYPKIKNNLNNKTLYFSHGFGIVYKSYTNIEVNELTNCDIIMVAPKGSGKSVRSLYKKGKGINSSYAVYRNDSGKAIDKALALGFSIGSPYIYETTFEKETSSDLTGERSILMGGIAGIFKAQYEVLRNNGHTPSEAFNETVEEALQSLYPLINEKGMDYMFSNCSTTAQRGALDWSKSFEELNKPLIEEIYKSVITGKEAQRAIECNSSPDYRKKLNKELDEIDNTEIWRVGKVIRNLRNSESSSSSIKSISKRRHS